METELAASRKVLAHLQISIWESRNEITDPYVN